MAPEIFPEFFLLVLPLQSIKRDKAEATNVLASQSDPTDNVGLKAGTMWGVCGNQKRREEGTFSSNVSLSRREQTLEGSYHTIITPWFSIAMWLQTAQGPRKTKKSTQALYFYSCESCAIFSTVYTTKNHFSSYRPLSKVTLNTQCKGRLQVTPSVVSTT